MQIIFASKERIIVRVPPDDRLKIKHILWPADTHKQPDHSQKANPFQFTIL